MAGTFTRPCIADGLREDEEPDAGHGADRRIESGVGDELHS